MLKKIILKNNLIANIEYLKSKAQLKTGKKVLFCACIKANAYGHGSAIVAKLIADKVDYFAVSNIFEANEIAKLKLKTKILILSPIDKADILQATKFDKIEYTVESVNQVLEVSKIAAQKNIIIKLHIKINSAMNRFGEKDSIVLQKIIDSIYASKNLCLVGIFTHYFMSESSEELNIQNMNFLKTLKQLQYKNDVIIHASNTGGIISDNSLVSFDMVRSGIGIYGYGSCKLLPVMNIVSKIEKIFTVNALENVGYSKGFTSKKKMQLAIVKIGYADGLSRQLANDFCLLVNGQKAKIIGNICMDCCFLNISNIDCKVGDEVAILNKNLTAEHYAKKLNTISYEVLCNFNNLRGKTIVK